MHDFKHAARRFCVARTTERLVSFGRVHLTKLHVYGATSGGLTLSYWNHGEPIFGLFVLGMAALDMSNDAFRRE